MNGQMGRVHRIHMVGIGGSGMSGIAEVLLNLGYEVSGSDLNDSAILAQLRAHGARLHLDHQPDNLAKADVVVISSAVKPDNPEVMAARRRRIPVVPRAEMLAELMRFRFGIAVAGTHGKTTVTSLIASVMIEAGLDPTFVIGGRLEGAGVSARLGQSRYLVAEADESDGSFLMYKPMIAVATNVDRDHLGAYGEDFEQLEASFVEFLKQLPFYGRAVLCVDDPWLAKLAPTLGRPVSSYGFEHGDFRATGVRAEGSRMHFSVTRPDKTALDLTLNLPGRHNVENAIAAVVVADELGIADEALARAFAGFDGVARRMERLGEIELGGTHAMLISDYGHHPREIAATFEAVREAWPGRRLVVVFQPHRYTRLHALLDEFAAALSAADVLILTRVYAAGEAPIAGADTPALARALRSRGQIEPVYLPELETLPTVLEGLIEDDDLVLALGAGNVDGHARRLARERGNSTVPEHHAHGS